MRRGAWHVSISSFGFGARSRRARQQTISTLAAAGLITGVLAALGAATGAVGADTAPPPGQAGTVSADGLPTVQINGVVWAQAIVGNTVYATGHFTTARPAGVASGGAGTVARANLLAFDITTGKLITSFNHALNGQGLAITTSPDGRRLYVGGDFTQVDGASHPHIVAFDTATGAIDRSFAARTGGEVRGLAATNSTVYAGGNFFTAGSTSVSRLAAFRAADGSVDTAFRATADDDLVMAVLLSPDGAKLVVAGKFASLDHQPAKGVGAVSASTGSLQPWSSSFPISDTGLNAGITALTTDGTNLYGTGFNFSSNGGGGNYEGRFSSDFAGHVRWLDACHGDSYDVAVQNGVLYSASHSHDCSDTGAWDDTNPRTWHRALAESVDPSGVLKRNNNGGYHNFAGQPAAKLLQWYPAVSVGTFTGQSQGAWSVAANADYVVLGGEFPKINGVAQQGLVRFAIRSLAPNKQGPRAAASLTPTGYSIIPGTVHLSWQATWDPDNALLTYAVYRDGGSTPIYTTQATSNFWTMPTLSHDDGGLTPGSTHTYKVVATDPLGNRISSATASIRALGVTTKANAANVAKPATGAAVVPAADPAAAPAGPAAVDQAKVTTAAPPAAGSSTVPPPAARIVVPQPATASDSGRSGPAPPVR